MGFASDEDNRSTGYNAGTMGYGGSGRSASQIGSKSVSSNTPSHGSDPTNTASGSRAGAAPSRTGGYMGGGPTSGPQRSSSPGGTQNQGSGTANRSAAAGMNAGRTGGLNAGDNRSSPTSGGLGRIGGGDPGQTAAGRQGLGGLVSGNRPSPASPTSPGFGRGDTPSTAHPTTATGLGRAPSAPSLGRIGAPPSRETVTPSRDAGYFGDLPSALARTPTAPTRRTDPREDTPSVARPTTPTGLGSPRGQPAISTSVNIDPVSDIARSPTNALSPEAKRETQYGYGTEIGVHAPPGLPNYSTALDATQFSRPVRELSPAELEDKIAYDQALVGAALEQAKTGKRVTSNFGSSKNKTKNLDPRSAGVVGHWTQSSDLSVDDLSADVRKDYGITVDDAGNINFNRPLTEKGMLTTEHSRKSLNPNYQGPYQNPNRTHIGLSTTGLQTEAQRKARDMGTLMPNAAQQEGLKQVGGFLTDIQKPGVTREYTTHGYLAGELGRQRGLTGTKSARMDEEGRANIAAMTGQDPNVDVQRVTAPQRDVAPAPQRNLTPAPQRAAPAPPRGSYFGDIPSGVPDLSRAPVPRDKPINVPDVPSPSTRSPTQKVTGPMPSRNYDPLSSVRTPLSSPPSPTYDAARRTLQDPNTMATMREALEAEAAKRDKERAYDPLSSVRTPAPPRATPRAPDYDPLSSIDARGRVFDQPPVNPDVPVAAAPEPPVTKRDTQPKKQQATADVPTLPEPKQIPSDPTQRTYKAPIGPEEYMGPAYAENVRPGKPRAGRLSGLMPAGLKRDIVSGALQMGIPAPGIGLVARGFDKLSQLAREGRLGNKPGQPYSTGLGARHGMNVREGGQGVYEGGSDAMGMVQAAGQIMRRGGPRTAQEAQIVQQAKNIIDFSQVTYT